MENALETSVKYDRPIVVKSENIMENALETSVKYDRPIVVKSEN